MGVTSFCLPLRLATRLAYGSTDMATTSQQLATMALGVDVVEWVRSRRDTPAEPSFQTIANELKAATGGRVAVSDQTIRNWYVGSEQVAS